LSDGLTEELITQLGRLHSKRLGVISSTASMRYKNCDKSVDQTGGELGAEYILEGNVRREGDRVRVTARFVRAHDQMQLWVQSYDRQFAGMLTLQSDLARSVTKALAPLILLLPILPAEEALQRIPDLMRRLPELLRLTTVPRERDS
jgi:adenylate cyclase